MNKVRAAQTGTRNAASKPGEPARAGGPGSAPTKNPVQTDRGPGGGERPAGVESRERPSRSMAFGDGGIAESAQPGGRYADSARPGSIRDGGHRHHRFRRRSAATDRQFGFGAVSASAEVSAGFSLAASGGIDSSVNAVAAAQTTAETSAARGAFSVSCGRRPRPRWRRHRRAPPAAPATCTHVDRRRRAYGAGAVSTAGTAAGYDGASRGARPSPAATQR